jgi:hypothetical protein
MHPLQFNVRIRIRILNENITDPKQRTQKSVGFMNAGLGKLIGHETYPACKESANI